MAIESPKYDLIRQTSADFDDGNLPWNQRVGRISGQFLPFQEKLREQYWFPTPIKEAVNKIHKRKGTYKRRILIERAF
jgi:hypothetical protein